MNILRIGRLSIHASKIQRGYNGENPSWRGYHWGSDWPRVTLQRSKPCWCIDLSWLMYFASIYWRRTP